MPVETPSLFADVIQDHLELKRKNADLDNQMPIERYRIEDPFENHPLFKTEEQARIEETMDGDVRCPSRRTPLRLRSPRTPGSRTASGAAPATSTGATEPPLDQLARGECREDAESPLRRRSRAARSYAPRTASFRCVPVPSRRAMRPASR